MIRPISIKYSRKEFTATLHRISLNGVACHTDNEKLVAEMKATFFKCHPTHPTEVYRVIDTTGGKDRFCGFVFSTSNGWGYIVRLKSKDFYCPFQNPETLWGAMHLCETRSEATARTIRLIRADCKGANERETRSPKVQQPTSHSSRDHEILGLPPTFTAAQLKQSYRKLCLKHHPDTGDGDRHKLEAVLASYQRLKTRAQS